MDSRTKDYDKWTAKNAWQCCLALVILNLNVYLIFCIVHRNAVFDHWLTNYEYPVRNATKIVMAALWLFLAFWLSGVSSISAFVKRTNLNTGPSLWGWAAAWIAICIAILDHYWATRGWTSPNSIQRGFYNAGGGSLLFYTIFVSSVGPFFEEVVMRGFLYTAFRGSKGKLASTFLTLLVGIYFHRVAIIHSFYTALCLVSLWVLLCILREWTNSVWNCVVCHAIYNLSVAIIWQIDVLLMVCLVPFCVYCSLRGSGLKGAVLTVDTRQ
ncbi:MAG: CPBP family intramembrane metalloprotease [Anaerolineaceae bacterium]|nr:CPBP family intramembrane metalloprotease [Anaerolineaceae bacterium]